MPASTQTPGRSPGQKRVPDEPADIQPGSDKQGQLLTDIVKRVQEKADQWRDALTVSIGRARELTDLEETRIRYFEELGVLQPSKSSVGSGNNRLYTLADLRCLYALTLLTKEYDLRPAEAAALVKDHRSQIEFGQPPSLSDLVQRESSVVADGFLLARLMSQLIDATQTELATVCEQQVTPPDTTNSQGFRVVGTVMLMRPIILDSLELTYATVQRQGRAACQRPKNALIALDRATFFAPDVGAGQPSPSQATMRDDSTILFYSRNEPYELPLRDEHRFCVYVPRQGQNQLLWLILEHANAVDPPAVLNPDPARRAMLDHVTDLCARIFPSFSSSELTKNYRYRSDGFLLEHSQIAYRTLLNQIVQTIFADPQHCVAALLIPNSLERPTALTMLAAYNYDDAFVSRVKLDLSGEGQGLCGRAYNLREPFFSSNAASDSRVAYALEEHSKAALAVPLLMNGFTAPLGVLYLASQQSRDALQSDDAYFALILANILSEQLGRWWLTRLRKNHDQTLHQQMGSIVRWLDSLGPHGRDFQAAIDTLHGLWLKARSDEDAADSTPIALVLFDIDGYRQNVQSHSPKPVPLEAQTHVHNAIAKIVQDARSYWFKNDHALVILHNTDAGKALLLARRIANQVRTLPTSLPDPDDKNLTITVSASIKVISYRDLLDLDSEGGANFRSQMQSVLDDLREQTAKTPPHTIQVFGLNGWARARLTEDSAMR